LLFECLNMSMSLRAGMFYALENEVFQPKEVNNG
jgi:hypothetical protein